VANTVNYSHNLSVLSIMIRGLFRENYLMVKGMGITELRRSPHKIHQIRLNLQVVESFLEDKRTKWPTFTRKFFSPRSHMPDQFKLPKDDTLNITTDELTNESPLTLDKNTLWTTQASSLAALPSALASNRQAEYSEEI
jgi:hypothetical protein